MTFEQPQSVPGEYIQGKEAGVAGTEGRGARVEAREGPDP